MQYIKVSGPGERDEDWGNCEWLMELDDKRWVVRQPEIHENGNVLAYDESHTGDDYGRLAHEQQKWLLNPEDLGPDYTYQDIMKDDFEREWACRKPMNR